MSHCANFFNCLNGNVDWKSVIKALTVKDDDNNEFINICYTDRGDCDNYDMAFDCLQDATLEDILELITGEDECGRPAINALANICQTCTDDPGGIK